MASKIVTKKGICNTLHLTTGKRNKEGANSSYFPNTNYFVDIPHLENWCVQHQFPLNKFPLNKFPLNKFPLNKFPLNKFPLNKFPLNWFSPNRFAANPLSNQFN
jgi:hypothetical protein